MHKQNWIDKEVTFAKIRTQIWQILFYYGQNGLDVSEITFHFKMKYKYLPQIDRRIREMLDSGEIIKVKGSIPKYFLKASQ